RSLTIEACKSAWPSPAPELMSSGTPQAARPSARSSTRDQTAVILVLTSVPPPIPVMSSHGKAPEAGQDSSRRGGPGASPSSSLLNCSSAGEAGRDRGELPVVLADSGAVAHHAAARARP